MKRLLQALLACVALAAVNAINVGDEFPSAILHKGFPPDKIDLSDYIKGRSVIVVGLPGAFTPT